MIYNKNNKEFLEELNSKLNHHRERNKNFDRFLKKKNHIGPIQSIPDLDKLPFVHVSVFKKYPEMLSNINNLKNQLIISSSGTSGIASKIYLDEEATKAQSMLSYSIMKDYLGPEKRPMIIYDLPPSKENASEVGARMSANIAYMRFSSKYFFALKKNKSKIELDIDGLNEFTKSNNKNILHFGFTYMIYNYILKYDYKKNFENILNKSTLIHIGGWKKLETEKIEKSQFNKVASDILKLNNVIDIYGFTELMGVNFPDCEFGHKHIPNNTRVIVRDINKLNNIGYNKNGLLQFISSFPKSYSGASILTDDMGILGSNCKCGRETDFFKITGRKPKSEIRGCGDILGKKMELIEKSNELYIYDKKINDLEIEIKKLKGINIPIEPLLLILERLSLSWLENPKLKHLQQQGLSFISRWCSKNNLIKLLNDSLLENLFSLDDFQVSKNNPGTYVYTKPKGIISHWVAGNVPLLGMLVLIQSIITKNKNIVKVSSNEDGSLFEMIKNLDNIKINWNDKIYFGKDIKESIIVARFSRNNTKSNNLISKFADVRVAWGGGNAIKSIKKYNHKNTCNDVMFGPKTSFSIISKDYINNRLNRKSFFLKLSRDISSFEQRACSSPHTIFYNGDDLSEFCNSLAEGLNTTLDLIPKQIVENDYSVNEAVMTADFTGNVIAADDLSWAIINNNNFILELPSFSRVIHVKKCSNYDDILPLIYDEVQSVSLGLEKHERFSVAKKLADLGVVRFPDIGVITNFDNPWDGKVIISNFISYSTLGGPIY